MVVALWAATFFIASTGPEMALAGELVRRPPVHDTCEECQPLDSVVCAISPVACEQCWATCGVTPGPPPQRVRPAGPTVDPWLHGGYLLNREIGVTQLAHEYFWDGPDAPNRLTYLGTNMDVAEEVRSYGFRTFKVWMQNHPFDGLGRPWCYDLFDTGDGDWWCETDTAVWNGATYEPGINFEDMLRFWSRAPVDQIFVRFERWPRYERRAIDGTDCMWMHSAPYYEIAMELFRQIGWRDITIVFTDWEQDWQVVGCGTTDGGMPDMSAWPQWLQCTEEESEAECRLRQVDARLDFVLSVIDERQADIERARRDAWLELGHAPNLRIMHAVTLNRWPGNMRPHEIEAGLPTLAENLHRLQRSPDLLGISYWKKGDDPALALDWFKAVTGYPRHRFYIDEFGGSQGGQDGQAKRFDAYVHAFWQWGIRTVNIWMWKQTWCAYIDRFSLGLWVPAEPCEGRVSFTGPSEGLLMLQRLQCEADERPGCWQ